MSIIRYIMSAPYKAVANYTNTTNIPPSTHSHSVTLPTLSLCCCLDRRKRVCSWTLVYCSQVMQETLTALADLAER